jgi:hypothetical protein
LAVVLVAVLAIAPRVGGRYLLQLVGVDIEVTEPAARLVVVDRPRQFAFERGLGGSTQPTVR